MPGSLHRHRGDVSGWELTGLTCNDTDGGDRRSSVANRQAIIDLDPGQSITCTYVNVKAGKIIVDKSDGPGRRLRTSFPFTASYDADSFSLTDGQSERSRRPQARHLLGRRAVPAGWDLTSATCSDGSPLDAIGLSGRRDRHLHVHQP